MTQTQRFLRAKTTILAFFFHQLYLSLAYPNDVWNGWEVNDLWAKNEVSFLKEATDWHPFLGTWLQPSPVTCCSGTDICMIGGPGLNGINYFSPNRQQGGFEKNYNLALPTHNVGWFKAKFFGIDSWTQSDLAMWGLAGEAYQVANFFGFATDFGYPNYCGKPEIADTYAWAMGKFYHDDTSQPIGLQLFSDMYEDSVIASAGIAEITFGFAMIDPTDASTYFSCTRLQGWQDDVALRCLCPPGQFQAGFNPLVCTPCHANCVDCWGPNVDQCFDCKPGYSRFASGCEQCHSSCLSCFNNLDTGCLRCPETSWYSGTNQCVSSCDLDLYSEIIEGEIKFCNLPCQSGYYYWDRVCRPDCLSPNNIVTANGADYCQPPCVQPNWYYEEDGVCRPACDSPMVQKTILSVNFCRQPCPDGEYLYEDTVCRSTCPSPWVEATDNGVTLCNKPCPDGEFVYPDDECKTSCDAGYTEGVTEGIDVCNPVESVGNITLEEKQFIRVLSKIFDVGSSTLTAGIVLSNVIGTTNPGVGMLAGIIKMLPYIRYIKINYPPKLQLMLNDMNSSYISFSFGVPLPDSISDKFEQHTIPQKFNDYGFNSAFILNYWDTMTSLGLLLGITLALSVIAYLVRHKKEIHHFMQALKLIVKWNFFLMVFCTNLDGVAVSSSLELRTLHIGSTAAVFSLLLCLTSIIGVIFVFLLAVYIIRDIRKKKYAVAPSPQKPTLKPINPESRWKEYQLFFKGSKDTSIARHYFMVPFLLRILMFYSTISFLFDYPLAQTLIIALMGAFMLIYMLWQKPFVSQLVMVQHCSDETVLLLVNISILILSIFDKWELGSENDRVILGNIVIYANIIFSFTSNIFVMCYLYVGFKGAYQAQKAHGKFSVLAYLSSLLAPYEVGGMDLDVLDNDDNSPSSPLSSPLGSPLSSPTTSPLKGKGGDSSSPRAMTEFKLQGGGYTIRKSNDTLSSQCFLKEIPENGSISLSSPMRERKSSITSPANPSLLHMPSLDSNYNSRTTLWKLRQAGRMSMLTTPKIDGEYPEDSSPFQGSPAQRRSFNIMNTPGYDEKSKSNIAEDEIKIQH